MRAIPMLLTVSLGSGFITAADAPPVKMGLWEKKMTIDRGVGSPMAITSKSCVTPETWSDMIKGAAKSRPGCNFKIVQSSRSISFSGNCGMPTGITSQISGSATIQDPEHIVAESHSTTTKNGHVREATMHSTSRFLGASCGNMKPGEAEEEQ